MDKALQLRVLATAIRRGSKLRKQALGNFFWNGGSCALGAAYEGKTGRQCDLLSTVCHEFPILETSAVEHDGCYGFDLSDIIVDKNDDGFMTREAIADWLDSEADKLDASSPGESVSVQEVVNDHGEIKEEAVA